MILVFVNGLLQTESVDYKIEMTKPPKGWCKKCSAITQTISEEDKCPKCSWEYKNGRLYMFQNMITEFTLPRGTVIQIIELSPFGLETKQVVITNKDIEKGQTITGYNVPQKESIF